MAIPGLPTLPSIPKLPNIPGVPTLPPLTLNTIGSLAGVPPLLNKAAGPLASLVGSIPPVPGLPSLQGISPSSVGAALMTEDAPGVSAQSVESSPQWGIYLKGKPIAQSDSVVSMEYRRDWHVADYPQEEGAFQTYNKVKLPYDARVSLTKGGTEGERQAFLADIELAAASTDLYEIWTPERTYLNANITRVDYRRTARAGVGLITVEIWLVEVRVTANATFSVSTNANAGAGRGFVNPPGAAPVESTPTAPLANTSAPSGADPVNVGTVQPAAPTQTQATTSADFPQTPAPAPSAPAGPTTFSGNPLPAGYTQDPQTGNLIGADGKVDRDMTAKDNGQFPPGFMINGKKTPGS